jgi:hypothetical protein
MSRNQDILTVFKKNGVKIVGDLVEDPDTDKGFLAFVRQSLDKSGAIQPSSRKLSIVVSEIAKLDASVKFVFLDEQALSVDAAIKRFIEETYSEHIASVVSSIDKGTVYVWLQESEQLDQTERDEVVASTCKLVRFLGLSEAKVFFGSILSLPSRSALLGTIRKHSPLTKEELVTRLQELKFDSPPETWLDNVLDLSRKHGFLYRRPDKKFILTLKGLNELGSRRNRSSPDVSRALAIARKQ